MSSHFLTLPRGVDALFEGTCAVGAAGQTVHQALKTIRDGTKVRASNWTVGVDTEIGEILRDCREPDWDGYGAPPVKLKALENAKILSNALYELLPSGIPAPDVVPEVDGDVSLSWTRDRRRGFSVSIGDHNRLSFAGILDKGVERHGVETLDTSDRRALQELAQYIARLYGR